MQSLIEAGARPDTAFQVTNGRVAQSRYIVLLLTPGRSRGEQQTGRLRFGAGRAARDPFQSSPPSPHNVTEPVVGFVR